MSKEQNRKSQEHLYYVQGAHCVSCELLIERELARLPGVQRVVVSAGQGVARVTHDGPAPTVATINALLAEDGYLLAEQPFAAPPRATLAEWVKAALIAAVLIAAFLGLEYTGITGAFNVGTASSPVALLVFGLLAGLSSCAALVGSLVLSLSRQWLAAYPQSASSWQKAEPHLLFGLGRLVSYTLLGALLGLLGSFLQLSETVSAVVVVIVALLMIALGLQMLGVPPFTRFTLALPKSITRRISSDHRWQGWVMPFLVGALTFFLPCGFTITAQSLALVSGDPLRGGLILLFFALGTAPTLLLIGLSSLHLFQRAATTRLFSLVAGFLVLFFALWTLDARLTVLGGVPAILAQQPRAVAALPAAPAVAPTLAATPPANAPVAVAPAVPAPPAPTVTAPATGDLPPLVDGKQVVRTTANAAGYEPRHFKVRVGVPVRWEITDVGTSGCTNALIAPTFFSGRIPLTRGQTAVKEFIPPAVGTFRYSCWMGMVTGSIQVME
jgi:sulfite exporter TauE/SafE/copper chaperone CopZ/plastocyanin